VCELRIVDCVLGPWHHSLLTSLSRAIFTLKPSQILYCKRRHKSDQVAPPARLPVCWRLQECYVSYKQDCSSWQSSSHSAAPLCNGARDGAVDWGNALQAETSWVRFPMVSLRPHYGPGVDSTCNRNEYQEYFLWGGGGGVAAVSRADSLTTFIWQLSGNVRASGSFQACTGIAYLFVFT